MDRLGFLDWGIGGIGVFRELRRRRPDVPVLYWSDSGATPYGRLPAALLAARVAGVLRAMAAAGVTQAVVACNAASTILPRLEQSGLPVLGVIDPAVAMAREQAGPVLGVVGGARTIRSGLYRRALATRRRRIIQRIAQPLSAHIEAGRAGTAVFARDLRRILTPMADADAILLACTHYPAARAAFQALAPRAALLDPAQAVVDAVLARWSLPRGRGDRFVTTGSPAEMRRAAGIAWGIDLGPCQAIRLVTEAPSARRGRTR